MEVLETCLYAEDLEAIRAFYEGVLGLPCFQFRPSRHAFFRAGRGVFLVFNPKETLKEEALPPHGALGPGHVAFRVAEAELSTPPQLSLRWGPQISPKEGFFEGAHVEESAYGHLVEWAERLQAQGYPVRWADWPKGRSPYTLDPAGNVVELAPPGIWGLE